MCVYAVVFVALSAGSGMLFAVLVRCTRALPLPLLPLTHRVLARVFGRCICLTTLIAFVCAVTNSVCFVCAQLISPMASSRLTTTPRFLRRRYQVIFCHSRIPLYSLFLFRFHSRFDFAREMCILSCPPPFLKRDECEWVGVCVRVGCKNLFASHLVRLTSERIWLLLHFALYLRRRNIN
jgi:hypothetical protein